MEIIHNEARDGGGIFNTSSSPTLTNVNFTGNSASVIGGGICNISSSQPTLSNCIIWGNAAEEYGNEIYDRAGVGTDASSSKLYYCLYGNEDNDVVRGLYFKSDSNSISVDPLFVDLENGDLRLQAGSPATNAGDPDSDLSLFPTDNLDNPIDLAGNPRAQDGRIDIGAYEYEIITSISSKRLMAIHETGLYQNYPNPFSQSTNIKFRIPDTGIAMLKVYDLLGNEVATLVNEEKLAGDYEVHFEATGLRSGVYIFSLATKYDAIQTKRMILIH
jgi:hypothetical protein